MTYPYPQPAPPGHPPYGYAPPRPSAATAIIAGCLALVGALYNCMPLVFGIIKWRTDSHVDEPLYTGLPMRAETALAAWTTAVGIEVFLLGVGAVLLWRRTVLGRAMVIVGSLAGVLLTLWPFVSDVGVHHRGSSLMTMGLVVVSAIPPLLTLILVSWNTTGRWVADRR